MEDRITGGMHQIKRQQSLIQSLADINDRVISLTTGRDRFNQVFSRMTAVEPLLLRLDPDHDPKTDKEMILLEEPRIKYSAQLLLDIKKRESLLDNHHLNSYEDLVPKLEQLRIQSLEQLKEARQINEETRQLITVYSNMMSTMKDILVEWDKRLKKKQQTAKK